MWLSLNIISDIVDIKGLEPQEIAERLTMSTAEIDGIDYMNNHLKTVYTAKIIDILPHPNADKLSLVDLDTGRGNTRVVCGAPNHRKDDIVAFATVGTRFTEDFTVRKTKIRGENSEGMLCSEKELNLSDDHSGIMILPNNTPIGKPLSELYPDFVDVRLEIDNKSINHRPDLWSHIGFAREIAAIFDRNYNEIVDLNIENEFKNDDSLIVTIIDPDMAPRYCGLVVKNIKIEESPDWLKARVTSIGMRPINNIVDITNYVMVELGEPMHAFDRQKLRGNEIIVRMAGNGEVLKTLDGESHKLTSEDIVISDRGGAIALAGVMGGGESEIDDKTSEIVIEAANFNPVRIRRTANRYNLRTEAAIRFEKYLDPNICNLAVIRCYDLIKQLIPDAVAITKIVDTYPQKVKKITVNITTDFIRKRLGSDITDTRITGILNALDFKPNNNNGKLTLDVPSYRATRDISIPEDIVEEIGRIYGYDNIDPLAPYVPCETPNRNEFRLFERNILEILSKSHHMIEVSHYSFLGKELLDRLDINEDKELRLKNPLSNEQDRLRRSLIPNLIKSIQLNQKNYDEFRIFELGRVYYKEQRKSPELAHENTCVSGVVFSKDERSVLFYDAKNIVMDLIEELNIKGIDYLSQQHNIPSYGHPGRTIHIAAKKKILGIISELHPRIKEEFDIKGNAAFFDLNVTDLFNCERKGKDFIELHKYPEVPFEVSILVDKYTYTSDICLVIQNSNRKYIKSVDVISIYEASPIPEGKKSVSIGIIFADKDKTLSPDEIENLQNSVIENLNKKGIHLR